jgi:chitinase
MAGIIPPRNVIYFSSNANQIPLAGIANLPYTDVIVAFLVPDGNLKLQRAGGAFDGNLQNNIQTLQRAGKNVLISFGGAIFASSAYRSYAQDVNGLVNQIVNFVNSYGFNGVDIDYEDNNGFQGGYDGIGFLSNLTSGLYQALPAGRNIITHAPQTPYWDPNAATTTHIPRYGSEWVIRSRGSTTNSTTTKTMIKTPLLRYCGISALPPLQEHKNC